MRVISSDAVHTVLDLPASEDGAVWRPKKGRVKVAVVGGGERRSNKGAKPKT